jgi:unsaturated chondroitin disaccharide hydrolase
MGPSMGQELCIRPEGSVDHVAFWDFDDPASFNATRDTAATAIVAAALLKLAALTRDDEALEALSGRLAPTLI